MKKITIRIILIMILLSLLVPVTVQAGYQANKNTPSKTGVTSNAFFEAIRLMESATGTLGKESEIDKDTQMDKLLNGIDCHMAKNTEWGTAAMLGASIYGAAPTGVSNESTTGNNTGVFQMADGTLELVAGIWDTETEHMNKIRNANSRYYNLYNSEKSKLGDATIETKGWFGASDGFFVSGDSPVFLRSSTGLFGYSLCGGWGNESWRFSRSSSMWRRTLILRFHML